MSKIGNKHIAVPKEISILIEDRKINIKGPMGTLHYELPEDLVVEKENDLLKLKRLKEDKKTKSLHGLYRQLIANAVVGVIKKWEKKLKIVGTGYNAKIDKGNLILKVGYSHPVIFKKVDGVDYDVKENNIIIVSSCDKQKVGEIAYQIKIIKKPDVYKGKGIQYLGEKLRIKPGKKAKTGSSQ